MMSEFRKGILTSWLLFIGFSVSSLFGVYIGSLISTDPVIPFFIMCISMGLFASILSFIFGE